jgi:hypothetical protein
MAMVLLITVGCGSVEEDASDTGVPADAATGDASPFDAAPPPDVIGCSPNAFIECADTQTARFCNAAGTALDDQACGAAGCNATAERCNVCVPDESSCDNGVARACGSDGLPANEDTCQASCVEPTANTPAHCAYVQPRFLPNICDERASASAFVVDTNVSIDTGLAATCNGGLVTQAGGPVLCVMRYESFRIDAGRTLTVVGSRALAVVTDGPLEVLGTLHAGAAGTTNGPGGGTLVSGTNHSSLNGGGGAGFRQQGGNGGGGTAGGGTLDPLNVASLIGGPRGYVCQTIQCPPIGGGAGGGGGGAATLISCRDTVSVSGTIDVAGGGGQGGADTVAGAQLAPVGGLGGGAGGQVVMQGLNINITGGLFANGGGGGGGAGNDGAGGLGGNGTRSDTSGANGGSPQIGTTAGTGGRGGFGAGNPGNGTLGGSGNSHGGGGGSTGYFFVYVPAGITPTLTPNRASPPLSPTQTAPTR